MYVCSSMGSPSSLQVEAALHGRGVNLMDHSRLFEQSVKLIEAMVILIRKKNDTTYVRCPSLKYKNGF